jgi:hypothetical protein
MAASPPIATAAPVMAAQSVIRRRFSVRATADNHHRIVAS